MSVHRIARPIYQNPRATYQNPRTTYQYTREQRTCFNCGEKGHLSTSMSCPAIGKTCKQCGKEGHLFATCRGATNKRKAEFNFDNTKKRVRMINEDTEPCTERNFVFYLGSDIKLNFVIGNCEVMMRVDSGSDITILSGKTWKNLKEKLKIWDMKTSNQSCFGYEKDKPPIKILCTMLTSIEFKDRSIVDKVYVAPNGNDDLIGYKAAVALKAL